MLISELTRHYNSNTNSSKKTSAAGTKGVERLTSSVRELAKGNIFEGTVNSVKGGQVVLGLSNGNVLTAKLDATIQLLQGQSMFFQVKSNDGNTIAICPYMIDGEGANPTLMNALKAANLPIEGRYLSMVNTMMQEQMPIDKNSMMQMARILMANPDADVQTLVQMKKLNIPITAEFIAQFENYMDDSSEIHSAIDRFITELPSALSNSDLSLQQMKTFDSQFLMLLADNMEGGQNLQNSMQSAQIEDLQRILTNNGNQEPLVRGQAIENIILGETTLSTINTNADGITIAPQSVAKGTETIEVILKQTLGENEKHTIADESINQTISSEKVTLNRELLSLIKHTLGDIGIKADDSPSVLLQKLAAYIGSEESLSKAQLTKLFSNKEMTSFLRGVMEDQFLLSPKEAAEAENIKTLYERLQTKMNGLDQLMQNVGIKENTIAQTLQDVRGNIQFMNQVNEAYTFIQLPLKMSNQKASGQLYVYTNKKDIGNSDKELTAFLHLDLDHLGATDVSVRMLKKEVSTKFYMETDESFALMEAYMPMLEERLRKKGYNCKVEIINEENHVNFVEDFLKKDAPSAGQLHRYSFDMRA